MKNLATARELIDLCKSNPVIIYGAGYVAQRFYTGLEKLRLSENVLAFCTTDGKCTAAMQKPVYSLSELLEKEFPENALFCIAVHESIKDSIIAALSEKGIHNVVWIYPYLFEIVLGEPLEQNVTRVTKNILRDFLNYSYLEVPNFLAIECYFGKNTDGYDLYVKSKSLFCEKETAEKRLVQFKQLIKNATERGFDLGRRIKICHHNVVLDGTHRLSMASYLHEKELRCDVYPDSAMSVHSKKTWFTEDVLLSHFDDKTIALFKETKARLLKEYCLC